MLTPRLAPMFIGVKASGGKEVVEDACSRIIYKWRYKVISYVNGKKIYTMKDLVGALEEHKGKYHTIVDEWGYKIVLEKNKVDENGQRILKKYGISSDRSKDLER